MYTAHDVATELRKMADSLDKEPKAIVQQCWITFMCSDRQTFLNTARLMPRPVFKKFDDDPKYPRIKVGSKDFTGPVHLNVEAPRDIACRVVTPAQPAVYDCEPLLSAEEEASLEVQHEG
jgi:hypothetical protein